MHSQRLGSLRQLLVLILTMIPAHVSAQATSTVGADPHLSRLAREVERLARDAGGMMGVAAVHLQTGRAVYLNRSEPFPMASSYKVPIAVELLTRVDRGELRLDSMITLQPGDLHPGSGTISQLLNDPGVILSMRNFLELMLLISDNSATDVLLRTVGGGAAVTARMRALGIEGIRVDRPTVGLIGDFSGVRGLPADGDVPPQRFGQLSRGVTPAQRDSASKAFDVDPRDTATPEGMARLLELIWRRQALSENSSALLLDIMTRSTTGAMRIKGILPARTRVAHKTGTIGGTVNDVGIIDLPDNGGQVVTVVLVKASPRTLDEREAAIAQVARAIYDYFLFNPGS